MCVRITALTKVGAYGKRVVMSRGLGGKQLAALSFLLDRHGKSLPSPVSDTEVRALGYRARTAYMRLLHTGHAKAHRTADGGVWWTLTRRGLNDLAMRRGSLVPASSVILYQQGLSEAGM